MNKGKKLFNKIERLLEESPKYWHIAIVTRYGFCSSQDRVLEKLQNAFVLMNLVLDGMAQNEILVILLMKKKVSNRF